MIFVTENSDNRHSDAEKGVNLSRLLMDFFDRIVGNDNIMVIGATNRPASVDIGLRRPKFQLIPELLFLVHQ
jgi:ATP-dependent Zn protease